MLPCFFCVSLVRKVMVFLRVFASKRSVAGNKKTSHRKINQHSLVYCIQIDSHIIIYEYLVHLHSITISTTFSSITIASRRIQLTSKPIVRYFIQIVHNFDRFAYLWGAYTVPPKDCAHLREPKLTKPDTCLNYYAAPEEICSFCVSFSFCS